jgi:hypothetical protein
MANFWRFALQNRNISNTHLLQVGAGDGEYFSNTLQLEKDYGWMGVLLEPDIGMFKTLIQKHRKAYALNVHNTFIKIHKQ